MTKAKRILSLFLVLATLLAVWPLAMTTVSAAENAEGEAKEAWTYEGLYIQDGLTMLFSAYDNTASNKLLDLEKGTWGNWVDGGVTGATFKADASVSWVARSGKGVGYDLTVAQMKSSVGGNTYLDMGISNLPSTDEYTVEQVADMLHVSENGVRATLNGHNTGYATEKLGAWGSWAIPSGTSLAFRTMYHNKITWNDANTWTQSVSHPAWNAVQGVSNVIVNSEDNLTTYVKVEDDADFGDYIYFKYDGAQKWAEDYRETSGVKRYTQVTDPETSEVSYVEAADGLYVQTGATAYTLFSTLNRYNVVEQNAWHSTRTVYNNAKYADVGTTSVTKTGDCKWMNAPWYIENPSYFFMYRDCASTVYAVRVYNRALEESEIAWNHAIDLLAYNGIDASGVAALPAQAKDYFANALASKAFTTAKADVEAVLAEARSIADKVVLTEYEKLYVTRGLTALYSAYGTGVASVDAANGVWLNKAGGESATLVNTTGSANVKWAVTAGGGVSYRISSIADYQSYKTKIGIKLPESAVGDGDATMEAIFTPYYISGEDGVIVPHSNNQSGNSKWGAYCGTYSNFTFGEFQALFFMPSILANTDATNYSGASMRFRVMTNNGGGFEAQGSKFANWGDSAGMLGSYGVTTDAAQATTSFTDGTHYTDNTQITKLVKDAAFKGTTGMRIVRDVADDDSFKLTFKVHNSTVSRENAATLKSDLSDCTHPSDAFFGFPANVYSIRVYNVVLTEAEQNQNRFADLAAFYNLDLSAFYLIPEASRQAIYDDFAQYSFTSGKETVQEAVDNCAKSYILSVPELTVELGRELADYYKSEFNMKGVDGLPLSVQAEIYYAIVNLCYEKNAEQSAIWALQQSVVDKAVALAGNYDASYVDCYVQDGLTLLLDANTAGTVDLENGKWYSSVGYGIAAVAGAKPSQKLTYSWKLREGGGVGYDLTLDEMTGGAGGANFIDLAGYLPDTDAYTVEKVAEMLVVSENGVRGTWASGSDNHNTGYATEKLGAWGSWFATTGSASCGMRTMYHNRSDWNHGSTWTKGLGDGTWSASGAIKTNSNVIVDYPEDKNSQRTIYVNASKTGALTTVDPTTGAGTTTGGGTLGTTLVADPATFFLARNAANTVYTVRVYDRALTEAELLQNYFVDLAVYFKLDVSAYAKLSKSAKLSVAAEFANCVYTVDNAATADIDEYAVEKAAMQEKLDLLSGKSRTEYDDLYVTNGLVGLFTSFGNDGSVVLEGGKWYNKHTEVGGYGVIQSTAYNAWTRGDKGGIAYKETVADWKAGHINGVYLDFATFLPKGDNVTLEVLQITEGLTYEDGSLYVDGAETDAEGNPIWNGHNQYGIYNGTYPSVVIGPMYMAMSVAKSMAASANYYLAGRWNYSAGCAWSGGGYWIGGTDSTYRTLYGTDDGGREIATYTPALRTYITSVVYADGTPSYETLQSYANTALQMETKSTAKGTNTAYISKETATRLEVMRAIPGTVYAVRIYDRALTETERQQNYFADLASYYELILGETFYELGDNSKVYAAMAKCDFTMTKDAVQIALDEAMNAFGDMARKVVVYEGLQARLSGATSGIRSLWSINTTMLERLESAGYTVAYGAIMGIGEIGSTAYNTTSSLTVSGNPASGFTASSANSSAMVVYVTGGADYATNKYLNAEGTQFAYTTVLDDATMETAQYYNIGLVYRAFIAITKDGVTQTVYVNAEGANFGAEDAAYGATTSIGEVADYFVNKYDANPVKMAQYRNNGRLLSILNACGGEVSYDAFKGTVDTTASSPAESGKILSSEDIGILGEGGHRAFGFTATQAGEYTVVVSLAEAAGVLGVSVDRSEVQTVALDEKYVIITVTLPVGNHVFTVYGATAEIVGVDIYHYNTYTFLDADGKTVMKTETAQTGSVITAPDVPAVEQKGDIIYTFTGFRGFIEDMLLTQDYVFVATYEEEDLEAEARAEYIASIFKGVICWGDSLTASAGCGNVEAANEYDVDLVALGASLSGTAYPGVIQNLIRRNVYEGGVCTNGGVGGEISAVIASRAGAYIEFVDAAGNTVKRDYRLYLAADVTIPASGSVVVDLAEVTEFADREGILRQGTGNSINPMYIVDDQGNKIEGSLSISVKAGETQSTTDYSNLTYTFTRKTAGAATTASAGNRVELYGETAYDGRIQVIYMGQNGGYNGDVKELYYQQLAMLYATGTVELNADKTLKLGEDGAPVGNYVIVGLHSGNATNRASMEAAMKEYWGDHYLNAREYLSSTESLADAGIDYAEIPAASKDAMAAGTCPGIYLHDGVHLNAVGYALLGNKIYEKMDALGYFDEVRDAKDIVFGDYE